MRCRELALQVIPCCSVYPLKRFRLRWAPLVLVASAVVVSCQSDRGGVVLEISAQVDSTVTPPVLRLSSSPNQLARTNWAEVIVDPDLVIGGGASGFGAVADVAELSDHRIAVLDPLLHQIHLFSEDGAFEMAFGREGEGPAEFARPLALERVGDQLVLWQSPERRALKRFEHDGVLIADAPTPVDGDWDQLLKRSPAVVGPITRGPEDPAFRLVGGNEDLFVLVQADESLALQEASHSFPWDNPPAYVLRLGPDLEVEDTIATVEGAPMRAVSSDAILVPNGMRGSVRVAEEDYLGQRPLIAAGQGWMAVARSKGHGIDVFGSGGRVILRVEWPPSTEKVSEEERYDAARWLLAHQLLSTQAGEDADQLGRAEIQEGLDVTALEWTPFPSKVPELMGAWGSGSCLFLSGFAPRDGITGASLSILTVDLASGTSLGSIRLVPKTRLEPDVRTNILDLSGGTVYEIGTQGIYLTTVNGMGEYFVERFAVPNGCWVEA